jgi:hypothetical protein
MSQELSVALQVTESKNTVSYSKNFNATVDVSGNTPLANIQSIGTSDGTLDIGGIGTLGYLVLKNLDATNYLEIGYTSGTYFAKLKPGESCVFRAGSGLTAIHAKANTAACLLEYLLLPD